jgi:hypothetical protein
MMELSEPALYELKKGKGERVLLAAERNLEGNQRVYTVAEGEAAQKIGDAIAAGIIILAVAAGAAIVLNALANLANTGGSK